MSLVPIYVQASMLRRVCLNPTHPLPATAPFVLAQYELCSYNDFGADNSCQDHLIWSPSEKSLKNALSLLQAYSTFTFVTTV